MKKSILGCVCLILTMSCDVPQSVTVKGKPELYMFLGSPFSQLEEGERLEDYISTARIKKMMGDEENITPYDYQPPGFSEDNPQTYVVHYPIAEIQHDLTEYVNNAFADGERVPPYNVSVDAGMAFPIYLTKDNLTKDNLTKDNLTKEGDPQQEPGDPLFKVSFSNMYKLVMEVESGPFAVELDYSLDFEENLRLRIPAFGMDDYTQGIKVGDKLRFVNDSKDKFIPPQDLNEEGELEIYVQVWGACSGTIEPQPVFEWTKAEVNIAGKNGLLSGKYTIENFLGNFLGEGVKFRKVKGYIYAHGIGDTAEMELKEAGTDEVLVCEGTPLSDEDKITFTEPFTTLLPPHSIAPEDLDDKDFIDLTDLLNNPEPSVLEYEIIAGQIPIYNVEGQMKGKIITIDLAILLPLDFIVETPSTSPEAADYVKLDMGKVFPENVSGDDLFGRNDKDDDLFSNINAVTISITRIQNTVINKPISVLIDSTGTTKSFTKVVDFDLDKKEIEPPVTIGYDELPKPFSPRFEILLKKDQADGGGYENYATFMIKRQDPAIQPAFDFFLTVDAQTDLNVKL